MYDITEFIYFANYLLHSIPQRAEIEAKKTGMQEKNSHNIFKVWLTNSNNAYDEVQELVTRQTYSGYTFVTVAFKCIIFLKIIISIKFWT